METVNERIEAWCVQPLDSYTNQVIARRLDASAGDEVQESHELFGLYLCSLKDIESFVLSRHDLNLKFLVYGRLENTQKFANITSLFDRGRRPMRRMPPAEPTSRFLTGLTHHFPESGVKA